MRKQTFRERAGRTRWPVKKKKTEGAQALVIAKKVDRKQKQDLEYFEAVGIPLAVVALNATPTSLALLLADLQGFKMQMLSVQVRGVIKQNLASAIIDDYRMDIVLDRRPDGGTITPALVYGSATPKIYAFKHFGNKTRFKILRSIRGYLSSSEGSNSFRVINEYVKLNLSYESKSRDSETEANSIKNMIYLIFWTTASANQPTIEVHHKIVTRE